MTKERRSALRRSSDIQHCAVHEQNQKLIESIPNMRFSIFIGKGILIACSVLLLGSVGLFVWAADKLDSNTTQKLDAIEKHTDQRQEKHEELVNKQQEALNGSIKELTTSVQQLSNTTVKLEEQVKNFSKSVDENKSNIEDLSKLIEKQQRRRPPPPEEQ